MRIGIDVGGTNTDAVLMDVGAAGAGGRVLAAVKTPTTPDVTTGVVRALGELTAGPRRPAAVDAVAIGTTHFTNAVVEARGLGRTAAVRLGLPGSADVPPLTGWPERLRRAIGGHAYLCRGGHEFDGRPIAPLDAGELRRAAADMAARDVECAAITSVFSPVDASAELRAAEILRAELPGLRISVSNEVGRTGLLERENATILNAALLPAAEHVTAGFAAAIAAADVAAPLYLSQNDGMLMDVDYVRRYPVATFAAGPVNSLRGAALLAGLTACVVVDVGGTTIDVGEVVAGLPRPAVAAAAVGGVPTNLRMPDVTSLGMGGGSLVTLAPDPVIGPRGVGAALRTRARVFGGPDLTATDVAVAGGLVRIGDPALVADLDRAAVRRCLDHLTRRVAAAADAMRTSADPVPLVLVGGGAPLLPGDLPGFGAAVRPGHFAVANAVGAAVAQVGGEVDKIYSTRGRSRAAVLAQARAEAWQKAVIAGAAEGSVRIVEVTELPMAYLPGDTIRVRVKAAGELVRTPPPPPADPA